MKEQSKQNKIWNDNSKDVNGDKQGSRDSL